jgi:predicted negative regulator of RcsB-dependent stress response
MRARAYTASWVDTREIAQLLYDRGDLDGLRPRADSGDWPAAIRLARLLARRGDLDELRARADTGDEWAAVRQASLLADRGDLDQAEQILRTLAVTGPEGAAALIVDLLAEVLMEQDRAEETERLRRFGFNPDGSTASE